jgi:hypothetical protein
MIPLTPQLIIDNVVTGSLNFFTLMMGAIRSSETWFLQEPHSLSSQKTASS